ncbi:MAG: hypothetical protein ACXQTY_06065 [Candidatus Methanogasteraceae archaeon]
MIDLDGLNELISQFESSDAQTVMSALELTRSIPHVETRLSLLEHAARVDRRNLPQKRSQSCVRS